MPSFILISRLPKLTNPGNDALEVASFEEVGRHGVVEGVPCFVHDLQAIFAVGGDGGQHGTEHSREPGIPGIRGDSCVGLFLFICVCVIPAATLNSGPDQGIV